jgi:hypothetical protein
MSFLVIVECRSNSTRIMRQPAIRTRTSESVRKHRFPHERDENNGCLVSDHQTLRQIHKASSRETSSKTIETSASTTNTTENMLKQHTHKLPFGTLCAAAILAQTGLASAATVAYWNFEEGTADTYLINATDVSGNGNTLTPWTSTWDWYRASVAATPTPQTGVANHLSVQNANNYNAMKNTTLRTWNPTAWTIEAAFNTDRINAYETFVGRDSQGAYASDPALSALYFAVRPGGVMAVQYTDTAGNNWNLNSAAGVVEANQWQAAAAVSDGSTLSLYLKNVTAAEPTYTLLGSLDISSSANSALSVGAGTGSDWVAGDITVGRGLWNGGHGDRVFGYIDDVRLSDTALPVSSLLYSAVPEPGTMAFAALGGLGLLWRMRRRA